MNPKFRPLYLLFGFAGLILLVYYVISAFADTTDTVNPGVVLLITIPDLVFFFLAYKTYPVEGEMKRSR